MTKDESYISIEHIYKRYKNVKVLNDINLEIQEGDFITILGPSGAGKSTLLKIIAGFESPSSGKIFVKGRDLSDVPVNKRNIGMLFQNYALFPHKTVFDNVAFPLKVRKFSKRDIKNRVYSALKKVKLEDFADRYPKQLSGGQQQRVALARAIVFNPPLLLLDEPMAALDKQLRKYMQIEIRRLHDELGLTTISVTHDQEEALTMATKVLVIGNNGRVVQFASPKEIYSNPKSKFVASFIGETNIISTVALGDTDNENRVNIKLLSKIYNIKLPDKETSGSEVTLSIRPEHIHILGDEENFDGFITEGIVENVVFIGDIVKIYIKTDAGDRFFCKCFGDRLLDFTVGDSIKVGIEDQFIQVVK